MRFKQLYPPGGVSGVHHDWGVQKTVGSKLRHRRLNVQTSTSNARSPFRPRTVSRFDQTDFGIPQISTPRIMPASAIRTVDEANRKTSPPRAARQLPIRPSRWTNSCARVSAGLPVRRKAERSASCQVGIDVPAQGCHRRTPAPAARRLPSSGS